MKYTEFKKKCTELKKKALKHHVLQARAFVSLAGNLRGTGYEMVALGSLGSGPHP